MAPLLLNVYLRSLPASGSINITVGYRAIPGQGSFIQNTYNVGNPTSYILVQSGIPNGAELLITMDIFASATNPQYGVGQNGPYTGQCGFSNYTEILNGNDVYINVNAASGSYVNC